jgi:hypothetical protein
MMVLPPQMQGAPVEPLILSPPLNSNESAAQRPAVEGLAEVPDMRISVMKGQPDRTPARRWISSATLAALLLADVCCRRRKHEWIDPRVEVEARMLLHS